MFSGVATIAIAAAAAAPAFYGVAVKSRRRQLATERVWRLYTTAMTFVVLFVVFAAPDTALAVAVGMVWVTLAAAPYMSRRRELCERMPRAGTPNQCVISIDGNIGAGKSTQLELLAGTPGLFIAQEELSAFGHLLGPYYADRGGHAMQLQAAILSAQQKTAHALRASGMPAALVERTPRTGIDVFVESNVRNDHLSLAHTRALRVYADAFGWDADAIVFVRTPPAVCKERADARRRAGEAAIDLAYLESLAELYDGMLAGARRAGIPVVVVDGARAPDAVALDVAAAVLTILREWDVDRLVTMDARQVQCGKTA